MDQYALLTPEQFNICESPNLGDPNQGIFADNGYSPAGGPLLTEPFTDLYPASNATSTIKPPPKKKRVASAEKKEADRLRLKRKREDAAATLLENEALKKAIKTKDESLAAMYEEIAVLKQQIAIDGNARANRAEKVEMKRGEAERIAAAVAGAVEKQAQTRADAAKAEAAFRAVQAKAEQAKQKEKENNKKIIEMMEKKHQREVKNHLLMLQSETMDLEKQVNTSTVSNSALKKQVATAQAEVAIQKMRINNLQTENKQLIFDLRKSKRGARELEAQMATLKLERTEAVAKEAQRVTDYYEQSVISNYQALIDRHRLSNILRVVAV